jgi:hypothetical protein
MYGYDWSVAWSQRFVSRPSAEATAASCFRRGPDTWTFYLGIFNALAREPSKESPIICV